MNVRQTLICFFLLSLQDGTKHLIGAENRIITEKEGGNIRHKCTFILSGRRRIFCREKCEDKKDILIDTTKDRDENGRYSIEYTEGTFPLSPSVLYVIITNLTKSDSGQYRCGLTRDWFPDSSEDFEVKVEDAPVTPTPIWTPQPFSPSVPSASTPMTTTPTITTTTTTTTTTQSLSSSSGSSSSSSASTEDTKQSQQQQTAGGSGVLLSVRLTLVIVVIVSSAAVLIFCRKRISKPAALPAGVTNYWWKPAVSVIFKSQKLVLMQSMLMSVRPSRCLRSERRTDAADLLLQKYLQFTVSTAARSQKKMEDVLSKLTCCSSDCSLAEDASPPLHSTVASPQAVSPVGLHFQWPTAFFQKTQCFSLTTRERSSLLISHAKPARRTDDDMRARQRSKHRGEVD